MEDGDFAHWKDGFKLPYEPSSPVPLRCLHPTSLAWGMEPNRTSYTELSLEAPPEPSETLADAPPVPRYRWKGPLCSFNKFLG